MVSPSKLRMFATGGSNVHSVINFSFLLTNCQLLNAISSQFIGMEQCHLLRCSNDLSMSATSTKAKADKVVLLNNNILTKHVFELQTFGLKEKP